MIYIDKRGSGEAEVAFWLETKYKIPITVQTLNSGDYYLNGIGIERKTIEDLVNSVVGGTRHFWEQLKVLKDTYKHPLLIIEGSIDSKNRLIMGIIYSVIIGWGVPYINTANTQETALILSRLHDRYGITKVTDIPPAAVKKAKSPKEIRWCMFQCISGIGVKGANQLIGEFPDFGSSAYSSEWVKKSLKHIKIPTKSKELLYKVMCDE